MIRAKLVHRQCRRGMINGGRRSGPRTPGKLYPLRPLYHDGHPGRHGGNRFIRVGPQDVGAVQVHPGVGGGSGEGYWNKSRAPDLARGLAMASACAPTEDRAPAKPGLETFRSPGPIRDSLLAAWHLATPLSAHTGLARTRCPAVAAAGSLPGTAGRRICSGCPQPRGPASSRCCRSRRTSPWARRSG